MATFNDIVNADIYLTCPYNAAHRFKSIRAVYHITKCAKNPNNPSLLICPYDARHRISESSFYQHLLNCPTSVSGKPFGFENFFDDRKFILKVNPTVSVINANYYEISDQIENKLGDWDDEINLFTRSAAAPQTTTKVINALEPSSASSSKSFDPQPTDTQTCFHKHNQAVYEKEGNGNRSNYRTIIQALRSPTKN